MWLSSTWLLEVLVVAVDFSWIKMRTCFCLCLWDPDSRVVFCFWVLPCFGFAFNFLAWGPLNLSCRNFWQLFCTRCQDRILERVSLPDWLPLINTHNRFRVGPTSHVSKFTIYLHMFATYHPYCIQCSDCSSCIVNELIFDLQTVRLHTIPPNCSTLIPTRYEWWIEHNRANCCGIWPCTSSNIYIILWLSCLLWLVYYCHMFSMFVQHPPSSPSSLSCHPQSSA